MRLPIKSALGANIPASQVRASVSAGSIHVVPDAKGLAELVFLPPAVVEKWTANLAVTVVGFTPSLRTVRIRLVPPRRPLLYIKTRASGTENVELEVPKAFILGEHESAKVTVRGIQEKPIFSVNTGRVSDPTEAGPGTWTATFSPPEGGFPQRVLLVASSPDGNQLHFANFDLLGRPTIETQSEPGATVKVQVGKQVFGPLRADSHGKLRLMVLAPPGVSNADVTATDPLGNAREMHVPLGAPDFNRVQVFCPEHSGRLLVFGTAPNGTLLDHFDGKITSSIGSLTEPIAVIPGLFESELNVPGGADPEAKIQLEARLTGSPASVASCLTKVPGEAPTAARLTLDRHEYHLDEGRVTLELKLTYPGKLEPRPVAPRISADHGSITDLTRLDATTFTARWNPPPNLQNVDVVRFKARIGRSSTLSATADLPVLDSAPAKLTASVSNGRMFARGGYITNLYDVSAAYIAIGGSVNLLFISSKVAAGFEVGHFSGTTTAPAEMGGEARVSARGVPMSARFTLEERYGRLAPYGGVGLGLMLARTEVSSDLTGVASESSTLPLARALGGVLYNLSAGEAGVEAGYGYCPMRGVYTTGNLCGIDITAAYRYSF